MNVPTRPKAELEALGDPAQMRRVIRSGAYDGRTLALALEFVQANLAVVPADYASDFLRYCQRNPRPCPLLAISEPGEARLPDLGGDLDVATDLPQYRVWRDGELTEEVTDVRSFWRDDLVAFALGCSLSFEGALVADGLRLRHHEGKGRPFLYDSTIETAPAGSFRGPMVVSMRPFAPAAAIRAVQITSRFPAVHGAPVHMGLSHLIGIEDLIGEDLNENGYYPDDEIPVFWGCGVTPQRAIRNARPPLAITHKPGHMLITDVLNSKLAVL